MVIRDSTHAQTSLTFNAYYPGYAVPILDCAAGHVYLAYAREEERESLLDSLARLGDRDTHHMLQLVREGGVIETVRASGHAARGFNRFTPNRSEERRVGKECVSTCRSQCSPCHTNKN